MIETDEMRFLRSILRDIRKEVKKCDNELKPKIWQKILNTVKGNG
jgi:hypothetical protein